MYRYKNDTKLAKCTVAVSVIYFFMFILQFVYFIKSRALLNFEPSDMQRLFFEV